MTQTPKPRTVATEVALLAATLAEQLRDGLHHPSDAADVVDDVDATLANLVQVVNGCARHIHNLYEQNRLSYRPVAGAAPAPGSHDAHAQALVKAVVDKNHAFREAMRQAQQSLIAMSAALNTFAVDGHDIERE